MLVCPFCQHQLYCPSSHSIKLECDNCLASFVCFNREISYGYLDFPKHYIRIDYQNRKTYLYTNVPFKLILEINQIFNLPPNQLLNKLQTLQTFL